MDRGNGMEEYQRPLIQIFLRDFKNAAKDNFDFSRRRKNMDTLMQFGLTVQDCKEIIISLVVEDCCKRPEDDRDEAKGGLVWFFGKNISDCEIYIKLKLVDLGEKKLAKCLSFHVANHALQYPLR
jgi:hypothetical protein